MLIKAPGPEILAVLALTVLLLMCSALISGSEVAFYSLKPKDLEDLNEVGGPADKRVVNLLDRPRFLLSTILIANNLINVAIVIASFFIVSSVFEFNHVMLGSFEIPSTALDFVINVVLVTFLLVLFGEVAPKIYAAQNNIKLAKFMSSPLLFLRTAFYPLSFIMVRSTLIVEKRLKRKGNGEIDLQEITDAIDITADEESTQRDIDILKGIVHFGNTTVKQIMQQRLDVVAVEYDTPYDDLMRIVKEAGFSRIPVYKESLDTLAGVLYVKDLLSFLREEKDFNWQQLIREPFFVPETKKIDDLLKEIQENRTHLAIVVDEYGGTSGIVTLEDIIEEILGEIKDEFDDLVEIQYRKLDDRNFIFEGKVQINDACRVMGIDSNTFDEVKGESDSLAGVVLELAGAIPTKNQEVEYGGFLLKVLSVGNHRIQRLKVTIKDEEEISDETE